MYGIVVLEEPSLSHDEQVAVAADMVPMFLDLLKYLIGRSGEHRAGFNCAFHGGLLGADKLLAGPTDICPATLAAARGRAVPEAVGKPEAKPGAKQGIPNPGQLLKNLFH